MDDGRQLLLLYLPLGSIALPAKLVKHLASSSVDEGSLDPVGSMSVSITTQHDLKWVVLTFHDPRLREKN